MSCGEVSRVVGVEGGERRREGETRGFDAIKADLGLRLCLLRTRTTLEMSSGLHRRSYPRTMPRRNLRRQE